ncbi:sensor histidine kinase inhibitor, KipI family [Devosia crocina]|uniref:Sensor histidine kinase inhibitor, KipI family n=1 Tax=Devosia crocina TaxID=429728 RepID=A0A1I7N9X7_9HYPH|nr:carboxyltransferase domain-containing protein [Devosia crocina]SFV31477.1 sensor histidine kinase inhibitor, KipI family [Devosia crocina]
MAGQISISHDRPMIQALGDSALVVRFGNRLDDVANRRAVAFARAAQQAKMGGVIEVVPSLVSVLVRYDSSSTRFADIAGEIRLIVHGLGQDSEGREHLVRVRFDGADLAEVCETLALSRERFAARHNEAPLRVLATGFAPGFIYCGFHGEGMVVPRRSAVRPVVPAGAVLFAAGQTAIAATDIPTGWHVIGRSDLRNFELGASPPTAVRAGDTIRFETW